MDNILKLLKINKNKIINSNLIFFFPEFYKTLTFAFSFNYICRFTK